MQFGDVDTAREGYVMVETVADGWWYTSPVPDGGMMAMLMTDGDLCARARLWSSEGWWERLQTAEATRASYRRRHATVGATCVLGRQPATTPA